MVAGEVRSALLRNSPLRVLVVEDSEDDALMVLRELGRGGRGTEYRRVETPEAMREALAGSRWDLIVSDHQMPRFSAPEALELAREAGSEAPLIVVSGRIGEDAAVDLVTAGAHDYVMKDNLVRLRPTVERALEEAEDRRERRRAEEELGRSEERYRAVIEQATDGIYLLDAASKRLLETNPAFRGMLGYADGEMLGMQVYDFVAHPRENVDAVIRRTLEQKRRFVGERKYRRKDGSLLDVEVSVSVISEGGKEVICTIVRDVSERKQAEEKLRSSEAELRAVFGAMNDVILVLDGEGRFLEVAPTDPALLFRPPGELLGKVLHDIFPKEQADGFLASIRLALKTRQRVDIEYSLHVHDRRRWFSTTVSPMLEDSVVAVARDITRRKKNEEELRGSEERFKGLAEATFEGVAIARDGKIVETNAAFAAMFGYEPSEVVGMTPSDFTAPGSRETVLEAISSRLEEPYEIVSLRKDGTTFDTEVRGKMSSYRGHTVRVTAIRDITERKRAEEALRQSERLYRAVLEQATEPIFLVDFGTRCIVEANPAFKETFGYAEENLGRMTLYDLVAADRESVDANVRNVMRRENPFAGVRKRVRQYRRNDGSLVDVEVSASTILRHGKETLCVVVHDVTERVRAQALLEERVAALSRIASSLTLDLPMEETLDTLAKSVVDASTATACVIALAGDEAGTVRLAGSHGLPEGYAAALQTAYRAGAKSPTLEVIRTHRPVLVREGYRQRVLDDPLYAPIHRFADEVLENVVYIVPLVFRGRAVGAINFAYLPGREPTEDEKVFLGAVADQTAVAAENARLFSEARGKAALEERQRIARELHDSVSQALYGIVLNASSARDALEAGDHAATTGPLDYVLSLSRASLSEMRALIFELRPEALRREGLVAALRKQAAAMEARHGIRVEAALRDEPDASPETKEAVYRIAQEALHNTLKHARASSVELELGRDGARIALDVADDGAGFDARGDFPGHLGLRSMRERAARLGGTLEIQSTPGKGTRVRARIPA